MLTIYLLANLIGSFGHGSLLASLGASQAPQVRPWDSLVIRYGSQKASQKAWNAWDVLNFQPQGVAIKVLAKRL